MPYFYFIIVYSLHSYATNPQAQLHIKLNAQCIVLVNMIVTPVSKLPRGFLPLIQNYLKHCQDIYIGMNMNPYF